MALLQPPLRRVTSTGVARGGSVANNGQLRTERHPWTEDPREHQAPSARRGRQPRLRTVRRRAHAALRAIPNISRTTGSPRIST